MEGGNSQDCSDAQVLCQQEQQATQCYYRHEVIGYMDHIRLWASHISTTIHEIVFSVAHGEDYVYVMQDFCHQGCGNDSEDDGQKPKETGHGSEIFVVSLSVWFV